MSVNRWPRRIQIAGVIVSSAVIGFALGYVGDDVMTLFARLWISFS